MTDKKSGSSFSEDQPSEEEIDAAVARLSEAWSRTPDSQRVTETGQIQQTLEKGRSHTVAIEVRRTRRAPGTER
jgi:hypothetical protein